MAKFKKDLEEELEDDEVEYEEDDDEVDEDDDDDEPEEDESEDDDSDEEDEEEEDEEPVKKVKKPEQKYSKDTVTKIISAKHNKMKQQFTKKLEELANTTASELDQANAIINWMAQNSKMSKEQILQNIGYVPRTGKVTVDPKVFDNMGNDRDENELGAEVNQIESKLKKYPGFKENKKDIIEYAKDTGLTVDKAYWALMGPEIAKRAKLDGAEEVRMRKQSKKAKVTETATSTEKIKTYTKGDKASAAAAGMTVEDYVRYSKMETYDDFEKARKAKKKK